MTFKYLLFNVLFILATEVVPHATADQMGETSAGDAMSQSEITPFLQPSGQ